MNVIVFSLKPLYMAPSEQAAKDRFKEFAAEWGERYLLFIQLWCSSWAEFVPFLEYDTRDPHHEHDRVDQRSLPAGCPGSRAFPQTGPQQ